MKKFVLMMMMILMSVSFSFAKGPGGDGAGGDTEEGTEGRPQYELVKGGCGDGGGCDNNGGLDGTLVRDRNEAPKTCFASYESGEVEKLSEAQCKELYDKGLLRLTDI